MPPSCDMEPGSETFLPAKYILKIYDVNDPDYCLLHFQASTPPPKYVAGDQINTLSWPLGQQGHVATVNRVMHACWSVSDQVFIEQHVYCDFQLPVKLRRQDP